MGTPEDPIERLRACVDFSVLTDFDGGDPALLADVVLPERLAARWRERLRPRFGTGPPGTPAQQASLQAARLIADGAWTDQATGLLTMTGEQRQLVREITQRLTMMECGREEVVVLAGASALEVTGSLSLRAAVDSPGFFAIVAVGYLGAFALLAGALGQGMPQGVGYGIWGASGVALTAVLSAVIFGKPLTALMGLGIAVVIGGVLSARPRSEGGSAVFSGDP